MHKCFDFRFQITFDLSLYVSVDNNLSPKDITSYLMILSDMEFDLAVVEGQGFYASDSNNKLFSTIRNKWELQDVRLML